MTNKYSEQWLKEYGTFANSMKVDTTIAYNLLAWIDTHGKAMLEAAPPADVEPVAYRNRFATSTEWIYSNQLLVLP
jgi:hypothetical protein